MEMEDLSRLWLGYGNNYVAEIHSSDYLYNAHNYGRLPSELEHIDKRWETIKVWNSFNIESRLLN